MSESIEAPESVITGESPPPEVTLVVTSCDRFDLLRRTLDTFFTHNTYPLRGLILTEDSDKEVPEWVTSYHAETLVLAPGDWQGQVASIDRAYAMVDTPYVFHLEDDWEFYRPGFIEASMEVLEAEPQCVNVWLRDRRDTGKHPIHGDRMATDWHGWHGFTWNPTLKRMADYEAVGTYSEVVAACQDPLPDDKPYLKEAVVGTEYWRRGFYAKITPQGYVRHIGWDRRAGRSLNPVQ